MRLPQKPWIDLAEFQMDGGIVELAGDIDLTIKLPWSRERDERSVEIAMTGPTCETMARIERRGVGTIGEESLPPVEL